MFNVTGSSSYYNLNLCFVSILKWKTLFLIFYVFLYFMSTFILFHHVTAVKSCHSEIPQTPCHICLLYITHIREFLLVRCLHQLNICKYICITLKYSHFSLPVFFNWTYLWNCFLPRPLGYSVKITKIL